MIDSSCNNLKDVPEEKPTENLSQLPEKRYFKIGEVCEITGVKQHVLRYWEAEFKVLAPARTRSKQRLYRREDVENVLRIKNLLKERGFTIQGAKKFLSKEEDGQLPAAPAVPADFQLPAGHGPDAIVAGIKAELLTLKKMLEG